MLETMNKRMRIFESKQKDLLTIYIEEVRSIISMTGRNVLDNSLRPPMTGRSRHRVVEWLKLVCPPERVIGLEIMRSQEHEVSSVGTRINAQEIGLRRDPQRWLSTNSCISLRSSKLRLACAEKGGPMIGLLEVPGRRAPGSLPRQKRLNELSLESTYLKLNSYFMNEKSLEKERTSGVLYLGSDFSTNEVLHFSVINSQH
ncbi:hypothetical protein WN51_11064 [Melipona quadrifasciata]|uniref:Uncharacterized protein n=1 Tax=Melipona quadrifasciata TaxID=166423 RepID=A0A0M9A697_9HYME|nr:hypothetical protein WN51_11064 [Melipona quadrifasciata]